MLLEPGRATVPLAVCKGGRSKKAVVNIVAKLNELFKKRCRAPS
jgi:hypothetical protein